MKSTKIESSLETILKKILADSKLIPQIVTDIAQHGGKAILVGGAVRDLLLHAQHTQIAWSVKDLDIEVHGLALDTLQEILSQYGPVSVVGKAFGVLRLHGLDVDWSLPRTDSSGRHPAVTINPTMDIPSAFARRDLTINAMGIDLTSFELLDPFNGTADLQAGILKAPDAKLFLEDPLRLLRVMQFIGRFNMQPDAPLNALCASMSLDGISTERMESEFDKLFLKSVRPSLGIRWLNSIGRLKKILPELAATIGVKQDPEWHPEGDVFEHTMQAIDAAALLTYATDNEKLIVMYAALCHDLGKVTHTQLVDGRLRSFGHDEAGVAPAKNMLKRITHRKELVEAVAKLVRYHMAPGLFVQNGAKGPAYKRLALKLSPEVTMQILAKVSMADKSGRNGASHLPLPVPVMKIDEFIQKAEQCNVLHHPEEPVLHGRDIMEHVKPGPEMGRLLKKAYEIQIEEGIIDKQKLLKRIL